ncbi:MAG: T9SS type A sorting domain-containing protein [Kordia sp.]|uniref:T9SS type A sorting domain-containing protein n=1 Tax=Kordia sp. TaxID=1965332 RepID=UPI00385EA5BB
MKKTVNTIIIAFLLLLSIQLKAQTDYTYTLIDNNNFNYTIQIVPETNTSTFATSVQSYGFTIILSDGVTGSIQSSLGSSASATFFDGNNVGDPSIDGYLITETLGSPISIDAPSTGMNTTVVTFQLNQPASAGTISILANDSSLATTVTPLQSFLTADATNDGMSNFSNTVNTPSGLSGTSLHNFMPLSIEDNSFQDFSISPNPVNTSEAKFTINWSNNSQNVSMSFIDLQGRLVKDYGQFMLNSGANTVNIQNVQTGIYFLKIKADSKTLTKKIIIE